MKKCRIVALLLVIVMIFASPAYADDNNLRTIEEGNEAQLFNMISSDLVDLYQFDITKDELLTRTFTNLLNSDPEVLDSFLKALFSSLDEYSEFYTPEEYEQLERSLNNITGGIGVYITSNGKYCEITGVVSGSPAEQAGVQAGDKILKVDGENVEGKGSDYVSGKVRGEIGTGVTVMVMRGSDSIDISIVRGEITQGSVEYALLDDNAAYLHITNFTGNTDKEVENALEIFDSEGVKKIIIDLRYNPGGYVDSAVRTAQKFVPEGIIATHYMKYNDMTTEYRSELKEKKYELVTLVNEYTASAAELFASALQDSGASKLVGTQTYGKAVTQAILGVYGGRMCKVTSGEYITRNGKKINKIGIAPDYIENNFVTEYENTNAARMKYAPVYNEGEKNEGLVTVKERLNILGYNAGRSDEYDEMLGYAVMAFQEAEGLEVTGTLDIATQMYIAERARSVEVVVDRQLAKAYECIGLEYDGFLEAE